jgi:hypothetical protein
VHDRSAVIIIDTGFSEESLRSVQKILAVINVANGRVDVGSPYLNWSDNAEALRLFAHDPSNHGSLVLKSLMALAPGLPVLLVRGYDEEGKMARTVFQHGKQVRPGWTEAYLRAVDICEERGLATVANLSFGGYHHALDGSGWESHCLAQVTGAAKPGHVVVAGAGAGNGSAIHSSWRVDTGASEDVTAFQSASSVYNLWCAAEAGTPHSDDWLLEVFLNDHLVARELSGHVMPNLWNNRKQICFRVPGAGQVRIRTSRFWNDDTDGSLLGGDLLRRRFRRNQSEERRRGLQATQPVAAKGLLEGVVASDSESRVKRDPLRFDCWISQSENDAVFLNHKDAMSIAEPAIFPHVIAVGLKNGSYAEDQNQPGSKPEVLLSGDGPISFRLPEVVVQVAFMLAVNPSLDVVAVRERLLFNKAA